MKSLCLMVFVLLVHGCCADVALTDDPCGTEVGTGLVTTWERFDARTCETSAVCTRDTCLVDTDGTVVCDDVCRATCVSDLDCSAGFTCVERVLTHDEQVDVQTFVCVPSAPVAVGESCGTEITTLLSGTWGSADMVESRVRADVADCETGAICVHGPGSTCTDSVDADGRSVSTCPDFCRAVCETDLDCGSGFTCRTLAGDPEPSHLACHPSL